MGLLIHEVFDLGLLLLEQGADKTQRLLRKDKAGGDDSLAACHNSISAAFLILVTIGAKEMALHISNKSHWEENGVIDGVLECAGILLDKREGRIYPLQSLVAKGVCPGDVRRNVSVGFRQVCEVGFGNSVALVGELQ